MSESVGSEEGGEMIGEQKRFSVNAGRVHVSRGLRRDMAGAGPCAIAIATAERANNLFTLEVRHREARGMTPCAARLTRTPLRWPMGHVLKHPKHHYLDMTSRENALEWIDTFR